MTMTRDELQEIVTTSAFDRWMGLQVETLDETSLRMRLPFREEIVGTPTVRRLHGGVTASFIDATGSYFLIARLNKRISTINLVIDFLRPAEGELVAIAQIVKIGRRICNVAVTVTGEDGKEVATGRLTIVPSEVTIGQEQAGTRIA